MPDSQRSSARRFWSHGPLTSALVLLGFCLTGPVTSQPPNPEGTAAEREVYYRQQLLADPDSPDAYLGLAAANVDQGRPEEGIALLSQAGDRWLRRGDYDKAQTVLTAAVEIRPDAALLARLGRAQTLNRNHQSAAASLGRAIDLGQDDPEVFAYFGTALWEIGRPEEAEARFRQSLELGRTILGVHQLGRLLLWQGRYEEAVPLLREVVGVSRSTDTLIDLADAQRGAGELEDAIVTYRRVVARAPEMIKAHYGLAVVLRASGDLEGAAEEFETVGRLHVATEERTRIQVREKGEVDRARELLRTDRVEEAIRQLESLSESVDSLSLLSQAYLRHDEAEKAARALESAVALDPGNSELRRQLSEVRRLVAGGDS
jgi:tetratricopeptide (TPR) repeat protein